ncbi:ABC transporter permease subunit [Turneriella parva]|uniref:ABC-type transporter, integral membrane subunit n=1 Tax=Turneriella parva (strain ATCC BAA-1111 / DSM 21527 / NCTC 11395 / H) TaxID=869212 RepID=I4B7B8_TURPD|nr:ABC transporter permease subunit [Turneriella parva]AFM13175.1 ABC-type transporter, integral membrane subunit [Turneriella parva DSM 21527]
MPLRLLRSLARPLGGFLTILVLVTLLTVFLQHLRKGTAEEALMGQRGTAQGLALITQKSFLTKLAEFAADLPNIFKWKSLRGTPIVPQIQHAFANTTLLTVLSLAFSVVIGLGLLVVAEFAPAFSPALERLATAINTTPIFLIGIFLIWLFSFALHLLPSGGDSTVKSFILPALGIALKFGARLFLLLTNYMRALEKQVFILRARAYSLGSGRIFMHKLANCAMPFVIFWLIETASLFSGAVIVESLFSIHGLGTLLLFALLQYDIRLIFANLVVIAAIVYTTSLIQAGLAAREEALKA